MKVRRLVAGMLVAIGGTACGENDGGGDRADAPAETFRSDDPDVGRETFTGTVGK